MCRDLTPLNPFSFTIRLSMFKHKHFILSLSLLTFIPAVAQTLPTKDILGTEYYVYEIRKGDSLYGILHRYGWEESVLLRLNPSLADGMKRGDVIYYPTGNEKPSESVAKEEKKQDATDFPPITHKVARGETPYSIARLYKIPLETLYKIHPSARSGLKAGETIVIDQSEIGLGNDSEFFYQQVKHGDTLYRLAKNHGLSVEELLAANPGLTEKTLRADETIRIPRSATPRKSVETVEKEQVSSLSSYKVQKDDTWTAISRKTGVEVDELREANSDIGHLKKNEIITVPVIETVKIEEVVDYVDPREKDPEGRQEIYDSIHHLDPSEKGARIAMIIDDPSARRDAEFSRGFLLALKEMGAPGYPVAVKIISGAEAVDAVVAKLDEFRPQAVVNLSDKGVQDWLVKYGNRAGVETVNVFDARTDTYLAEPSVIQLMTPSNNFYALVAREMQKRFADYTPLFVSKHDASSDPVCDAVMGAFQSPALSSVTLDALSKDNFVGAPDYLVIADLADKEEAEKLFSTLENIREQNPALRISVFGRPSWVVWSESLAEEFYKNNVLLPSRFFFSSDESLPKAFIDRYSEEYGRGPLKSFPNYAASGYDIANFFVPNLAANGGDFNERPLTVSTIQTPIDIQRISNWGGFYNSDCLLVEYTPYRTIERIILKN